MSEPHVIDFEAQRKRVQAAYHDPSWAPRACDRCGERYTGPAVYCSHACALADAGGDGPPRAA